jgi:membrane-associated phospholipid phosphatase
MRLDRSSCPPAASRFARLLFLFLVAAVAPASPARAGVLLSDLKEIGSVRTARILGGAAALGALSLLVENPAAEERALGRGAIDAPADLGNIYGGGILLAGAAGGLAGAGLLEKDPDWVRAGSEMVRSMAYAGAVVTALKITVRRTRPNGGAYSFPSGHSAVAFAVAPVLGRRFGLVVALPAYALAVSTALGRMEDRKHYLSDVVVGAGIGTAIGMAIASEKRDRVSEPAGDDAARSEGASSTLPATRQPRPVLGFAAGAGGLALTARF